MKQTKKEAQSEKLALKNVLKIGVPIFALAVYAKFLMDNYKIKLQKPPEDADHKEKSQEEIIEDIEKILDNADSIVGCLFPHTSLADHVVFNRELQRWSDYQTAWIATKKFITGKMGFAGMLAQAWFHVDKKVKMFYVTQAYLREKMTTEEANEARKDNIASVKKATQLLEEGSSVIFFYPEGTRVNKAKGKQAELARAHPTAFATAEAAAEGSDNDVYLSPMYVGEVPTGKKAFIPSTTELTYGQPINITQLRKEFEALEGKILFTDNAMNYHHYKNPAKQRKIIKGVKQLDKKDGSKLYIDKSAVFGFADFVMWKFSKLMPKEKRGIYSDDCVQVLK